MWRPPWRLVVRPVPLWLVSRLLLFGLEPGRCAAIPVRAHGDGFSVEVEHDKLGYDEPITSIPLERKLYVRTCCVSVVNGIVADVISAPDELTPMEKLEETDWCIPMDRADPSTGDRELGMEPVPVLMSVIVPWTRGRLQSLPFVPPCEVLAIGSVDAGWVQVSEVQKTSEFAG